MFLKSIEDITIEDIFTLKEKGCVENNVLEFKEQLNLSGDQKTQLLSECCSFLNTQGGDLLVGVKEDRTTGAIKSLTGVDIDNIDKYKRQLQDIIRSNIYPLVRLSIKEFKLDNGKYILLIRIYEGEFKPYMVNSRSGFYIRDEAGKRPMQYEEIKGSFISQQCLKESIDLFVQNKVNMLLHQNTEIGKINDCPKVLIHIIPIRAYSANGQKVNNFSFDLDIESTPFTMKNTIRYFPDGFVLYDKSRWVNTYTRVYQNGIVEHLFPLRYSVSSIDKRKYLQSTVTEKYIIDFIQQQCLPFLKSIKAKAPVMVCISFLNVENFRLDLLNIKERELIKKQVIYPLEMPLILLKSSWVYDLTAPADNWLREPFNTLWRYFGTNKDYNYVDGKFNC